MLVSMCMSFWWEKNWSLLAGFIYSNTARKTIFSFSKCFKKMVFPKKSHWNMIFLVLSGKMIFIFPENMVLFFRRKRKDDLSQKKYLEIWCFLQMFWKDNLSKNSHWKMIFFVRTGKMVFLFFIKYAFSLDPFY